MDDLAIKIAITYKVPIRGLTFTGLLRGLERDGDTTMRAVLETILAASEEDSLKTLPEGRARNGHQSRPRTFRTSLGLVRLRMAQVRDLKGTGPSKSTLWRRLQDLAEMAGAWPPLRHRPFRFLMVDGKKVRLQNRGPSLEKAEMRWAMATEEVSQPFEWIGGWVNEDRAAIRRALDRRLNYRRLRVLFSDDGPGIQVIRSGFAGLLAAESAKHAGRDRRNLDSSLTTPGPERAIFLP